MKLSPTMQAALATMGASARTLFDNTCGITKNTARALERRGLVECNPPSRGVLGFYLTPAGRELAAKLATPAVTRGEAGGPVFMWDYDGAAWDIWRFPDGSCALSSSRHLSAVVRGTLEQCKDHAQRLCGALSWPPSPDLAPEQDKAVLPPVEGPEAPTGAVRALVDGERLTTLGAALNATVGPDVARDFPEFASEQRAELLDDYRAQVNPTANDSTPLVVTKSGGLEGWHYSGFRMCAVCFLATPTVDLSSVVLTPDETRILRASDPCGHTPRRRLIRATPETLRRFITDLGCTQVAGLVLLMSEALTRLALSLDFAPTDPVCDDYRADAQCGPHGAFQHGYCHEGDTPDCLGDHLGPHVTTLRAVLESRLGYTDNPEHARVGAALRYALETGDRRNPGLIRIREDHHGNVQAQRPDGSWGQCLFEFCPPPRPRVCEFTPRRGYPKRCARVDSDTGRFTNPLPYCNPRTPDVRPVGAPCSPLGWLGCVTLARSVRGPRSVYQERLNGHTFDPERRMFDRASVNRGAIFLEHYPSAHRWVESMPDCQA